MLLPAHREPPPGRLPPPSASLHFPGISARRACTPALLWVGKLPAAFRLHSFLAGWAPSPLSSFPGLAPTPRPLLWSPSFSSGSLTPSLS